MTEQTCSDCGTALRPNNRRKGTRCKRCAASAMARSPEKRAKCREAMLRHFVDPHFHAAHCARIGEGIRRSLQDPERLADLRERGRKCGLLRMGINTYGAGSEPRLAAGRRRHDTVMAWCPIEYRAEYRRLVSTKLIRAPEARRMIEEMVAADLAKALSTGVLPQANRIASGATGQ